jgi:hypothetical protein
VKVQRQRHARSELDAQHPDPVVRIEEQRMRLDAGVQQALEELAEVGVDGQQVVLGYDLVPIRVSLDES